jgi:type I restriction enzyme S subunit
MFYKETNFKETPLGKIPREWNIIHLRSIAKISSGNTAPQDEKYFKDGKYPFIRVQHLTELYEQKYPVNYDLINEYAVLDLKLRKFKKGSIIFPKSGESIKLEKRAILKEDSYVVNHLAVIEPFDENVDNLFLFYYLCTVKTSNYLTKTTMPSLNLSTISNFLVPLPSLPEQQKIAEILSTVDKAIHKTNEIIAKTERLKKGLMQELLTKGIGHKEFKDTEIGRIPKEWEVVKLRDVVTYRKGVKPKVIFDWREPNTLPYLTADDVRAGIFTKWARESDKIIKVNKDDVILIWDGFYCGDAFIGLEGILSSTMIKIEPKSNLNGRFLFYILKTHFKELNTKISGMYLKHVNKSVFENLKLPLPLLQEQQKIAEILSIVDKKLEVERNEKAKLEKIKQGLMDLLLTGKIRVKVG